MSGEVLSNGAKAVRLTRKQKEAQRKSKEYYVKLRRFIRIWQSSSTFSEARRRIMASLNEEPHEIRILVERMRRGGVPLKYFDPRCRKKQYNPRLSVNRWVKLAMYAKRLTKK